MGIRGLVLTFSNRKIFPVPNFMQAAAAKASVARTSTGISAEKALTIPVTPSRATSATASMNRALPIHVGRPVICSNSAPDPAAIMTTTPNRKAAATMPEAARSHGIFQGTSSRSISSVWATCVSRTSKMPNRVNSTAASRKPT